MRATLMITVAVTAELFHQCASDPIDPRIKSADVGYAYPDGYPVSSGSIIWSFRLNSDTTKYRNIKLECKETGVEDDEKKQSKIQFGELSNPYDISDRPWRFKDEFVAPGRSYRVMVTVVWKRKQSTLAITKNITIPPEIPAISSTAIYDFQGYERYLISFQLYTERAIADQFILICRTNQSEVACNETKDNKTNYSFFIDLAIGKNYSISGKSASHGLESHPSPSLELSPRMSVHTPNLTFVSNNNGTAASKSNGIAIYILRPNATSYPKDAGILVQCKPDLSVQRYGDCLVKREPGKSQETGPSWKMFLIQGLKYEIKILTYSSSFKSEEAINITVAPEDPKLNYRETSQNNGYRLYTVKARSNSHYSYLKFSCEPQLRRGQTLPRSEKVVCDMTQIDRDTWTFNLKAGLDYKSIVHAFSFGVASKGNSYLIFKPDTFPPSNIKFIPHPAPEEGTLQIIWTNIANQFIKNTVISCDYYCPNSHTQTQNESITLTGLQGGRAYTFQFRTSSLIGQRLSKRSEQPEVLLYPPQESQFNISHRHNGTTVADGSFYIDLTLPNARHQIKVDIVVQIEIFNGKSFSKALNHTVLIEWISGQIMITDREIILDDPAYKQPGQRYQFNLFIHAIINQQRRTTPGATKDIIRTIVPSTPKTLTVVENPLLPALLLVWDLDPSSLVDEVYIKVCSLKKCPEKTFTANKMQNDMLNHFNISQDILDKNVTYSFSITASSYGTMGSESLKAYLTKKALCLHPKETIGILVNKNEQRTWYFIDGRSYYIVCPGGFKTQEDGELWLCSDGEWVDGTDCVLDRLAASFTVIGVVSGGLLLIGAVAGTFFVKTSRKRRKILQGAQFNTAAEKLQGNLTMSAVMAIANRHPIGSSYTKSQGSRLYTVKEGKENAIIDLLQRELRNPPNN